MINRRVFLKSLGMGTGAFVLSSGLFPRPLRAAADRSFIFAYFQGGWDTLLSLDPRDPNVFTDARIGETKIELAWDRLDARYPRTLLQPPGSNIELGPVMAGIAPHFAQACVVRGISMDTVTHEVGRRYFITGLPPRGLNAAGSSMPTRIVAQQGDHSALPNLVARVESYNERDPAFASGLTVNSVGDLVIALTDGPDAPNPLVRSKLTEYRARAGHCDPAGLNKHGFFDLIRDTQTKARAMVEGGLSRLFQFGNANDPDMVAISTRYEIQSLTSPQAQAAMAYQALRNGLAQCVSIELAPGLDTHDATWATDHPDLLSDGFGALGTLVGDLINTPDLLRGGNLIDHTTIVAFSEFGRTALLNSRDGRDHSLTSSALLLGAGVPKNKVVGASSDIGMNPRAIDPSTGEPVASGGVVLSPTTILASVMQSAGLSTEKLRTDGLPCLMA